MNSLAWIGVIVWGIVLTGLGLLSSPGDGAGAATPPPHDVVFIVAGGLLTCMIGAAGLLGMMGWIPGLRDKKSTA